MRSTVKKLSFIAAACGLFFNVQNANADWKDVKNFTCKACAPLTCEKSERIYNACVKNCDSTLIPKCTASGFAKWGAVTQPKGKEAASEADESKGANKCLKQIIECEASLSKRTTLGKDLPKLSFDDFIELALTTRVLATEIQKEAENRKNLPSYLIELLKPFSFSEKEIADLKSQLEQSRKQCGNSSSVSAHQAVNEAPKIAAPVKPAQDEIDTNSQLYHLFK